MKGAESIFVDKNSDIGVLMLHGFSSTPAQYKDLCAFLSKNGINASAPLIAGHGTCPDDLIKTCPEDWEKSAKDAYLKLKKISKKVFIIGNSFGSNLALWLAKEFNNEQAGIITLGAPIFMRFHYFTLFRLYTYGLIKKYYSKPTRIYEADYIDMNDEVTYPVIPAKSLREFFGFIKSETIPSLGKIKLPALICHSAKDKVAHPKSAAFIYEHIQSPFKKIYFFPSDAHTIMAGEQKTDVFQRILEFIKEKK